MVVPQVLYQSGVVPFMNENQIRFGKCGVQIERRGVVPYTGQRRVDMTEACERVLSLIREQVGKAPGVGGFPDADMVTSCHKFRDDATKKMCVAMVPAGQQRVTEYSYVHDL
jgi:hypothetical protein